MNEEPQLEHEMEFRAAVGIPWANDADDALSGGDQYIPPPAIFDAPDIQYDYNGPFQLLTYDPATGTDYTGRIYCSQGYITLGWTMLNFPTDNPGGVNNYVTLSGTATHFIYFSLVVDSLGAIDKTDSTEIPLLLSTTTAWSSAAADDKMLIGEVDTVSDVITDVRQRRQGSDIYMPVMGQVDSSQTIYYDVSLMIEITADSKNRFTFP